MIEKAVLTHLAGLLQRLEEETNVNTYIVKQKLPKEIDTRHSEVEILRLVLSEPVMSRGDLDALNNKVTDCEFCTVLQ
jgi:intraflagellar transport protein 81